jgi:hypothetical protein
MVGNESPVKNPDGAAVRVSVNSIGSLQGYVAVQLTLPLAALAPVGYPDQILVSPHGGW